MWVASVVALEKWKRERLDGNSGPNRNTDWQEAEQGGIPAFGTSVLAELFMVGRLNTKSREQKFHDKISLYNLEPT